MLLLLFFSALLLLASLCSLFSFLGTCHRVQPCPALRVGLGALCLLPVWFRGDVLCRMGRRDAVGRCNVLLRVLLARTSAPTAIASPHSKQTGALYLPVIDLAPRGEGGMVASAEEADSSASSASSDRPSAVLPIVSPPRGLLAWVS